MNSTKPTRSTASIILYVLAGLVLVLGIYFGLSIIQARANLDLAFVAFPAPILNALLKPLQAGLLNAGIGVIVVGALLAGALVYGGRLAQRNHALRARVAELERLLATSAPAAPAPLPEDIGQAEVASR